MAERDLTISAVIPTYNCASVLCDAIDSVLAQTRPPDEVIVVDDASTDETARVLSRYGKSVRCIRHEENAGAAAARNTGIRAARCRWVAFLDADDIWLENHLADVIRIFDANPSLVWACSNLHVQRGPAAPVRPTFNEDLIDQFVSSTGLVEDALAAMAAGMQFTNIALVIRKDVIEQIGGFDPELRRAEDMDMRWRMACAHPQIGFARQPGSLWRNIRADSLTTAVTAADIIGVCKVLERHLELTKKAGRLDSFLVVAARRIDVLAYRALYSDNARALRYIARRHGRLLRPVRRCPVYLASLLPGPGRAALRFLLRLRLWIMGRPFRAVKRL